MTLLKIEQVSKTYRGGVRANDDLSLVVAAGEVFGLLGPNGAGKSTLVNQVIGLAAPSAGKIYVDGVDVVADPAYARQACSFQPQSQVPIEGLTLFQAVELVGRVRGGRAGAVRQRARRLIEALEIDAWAEARGETLSGGVRRLAAFCMAAVVPGRLVILDEPTTDVDPLRRRLLWQMVRRLARDGAAVLLVTHNVLEAERSVHRLAVIDHGRVVGLGTPAALKGRAAQDLRLALTLEPTAAPPPLPAFVGGSVTTGRHVVARVQAADVGATVAWAHTMRQNGRIEEFSLGPATLEDAYVRLIGRPDALEMPNVEVQRGLPAQVVS
jgi:ABC-2 type transport system ATP-binding protein